MRRADLSVDGGPAPTCTPATCSSIGAGCGTAGDGCGGMLDCGTCASPTFCGGGGSGPPRRTGSAPGSPFDVRLRPRARRSASPAAPRATGAAIFFSAARAAAPTSAGAAANRACAATTAPGFAPSKGSAPALRRPSPDACLPVSRAGSPPERRPTPCRTPSSTFPAPRSSRFIRARSARSAAPRSRAIRSRPRRPRSTAPFSLGQRARSGRTSRSSCSSVAGDAKCSTMSRASCATTAMGDISSSPDRERGRHPAHGHLHRCGRLDRVQPAEDGRRRERVLRAPPWEPQGAHSSLFVRFRVGGRERPRTRRVALRLGIRGRPPSAAAGRT